MKHSELEESGKSADNISEPLEESGGNHSHIPDESLSSRQSGNFSLVRIQPHTGRKHQIRIHLSHLGHPIVGDKLYGGDEDLYLALVQDRLTADQKRRLILANHALHARQIGFFWRQSRIIFEAAAPSWLVKVNAYCDDDATIRQPS